MDTFEKLQQFWSDKHLEFLIFFLDNHSEFYEDGFLYRKSSDGTFCIDNDKMHEEKIILILADYYDDKGLNLSSFGDFLYLVFTDMVEDNVDILSQIEEEDVA